MKRYLHLWGVFLLVVLPVLACGPSTAGVTPTPTKTPRLIRTVQPLASAIAPTVLPTDTFTPEPLPTDTPTPEPPPTDTPTPEPPPTDTPPPPPPPTNPPPPPPTDTPEPPPPPPPTEAPAPPPSSGPQIVIELPDGDRFDKGDDVRVVIIVRDPDGVASFEWGIFTENNVSVKGGNRSCGNATECRREEKFEAVLSGAFQVGVKAVDSQGNKSIEVKQIYVG